MEQRTRADYLKQLNETFVDLASVDEHQMHNIDGMLKDIIDRSRDVLDADLIEFYQYSQRQKRFRVPQIKSGDYIAERARKDEIYEDDVMHHLIKRHKPLYIETSDQVPAPFNEEYFVSRENVPTKRFYIREKIASLAVIPIRAGDENVGLMFANFRKPTQFDDELKEIINLFTAQTAIVIRNARLYHHLYQRRKALIDVGMALNTQIGEADQKSVFNAIYDEAKNKLEMQDLSLSLYESEKNEIRFVFAYFNGKPVDIDGTPTLKKRIGLTGKTGWVIENRRPLNIPSIEELHELEFTSSFYGPGNRSGYSWLGVPMWTGEKVLGVLATHNYRYNNAFSQHDVDTLQGLADIAAIAINNIDLYNNLDKKAKELAAEKEEERQLLHTVINNIPAYIYAKDKDSKFKIANKTVADIMDAEAPADLLEKTDFDYYPPDEAERYYQDERRVVETGVAIENQREFSKDRNGNPRVTLTTKVPWRDTQNRTIGTIGIGMEITDLYEAQTRLQAVIDQIPDHVYLKDKKSRFLLANTTVLKEFGLSSVDEVIGKTDFDFHPQGLAQEYYDYEQKLLRLEEEPKLNKSEKTADPSTGKIRRLLTTKLPFKNEHGEVTGIIGINRDITEGYRNYSIRLISDAAYNAEDLNEFYGRVYEILNEILPADNLYITEHIPEKGAMKYLFFKGNKVDYSEKEFPASKGLAGYVFRTRAPLLASAADILELETKENLERIGGKSKFWMGAPLIASKDIGVIAVQSYDDNIIYDDDDLALLNLISNPIAQAIERILKKEELEAESQDRKKRLEALYKISEAARNASSLHRLYESIHGIIHELIFAENIFIALCKEGCRALDLQYYRDEVEPAPSGNTVLMKGLTGYVLEQKEPLLATPGVIEELVSGGEIEIVGARPVGWIAVPLRARDKIIGIISIRSYSETNRYKEDDKDLMAFVSEQIAMAIEQVRAKEIQIKALENISASIIAPTHLDEVIEGILETTQEMMDEAAICDVLLWDKTEEKLKIKWVRGQDGKKNFEVELGEGITGWVAKNRKSFLTANAPEETCYKELHSETKSELAVPIINESENELIGVLNIEHPEYGAFNEDDRDIAIAMGNLAAIAIANKNLIKERDSLKNLAQKLSKIV